MNNETSHRRLFFSYLLILHEKYKHRADAFDYSAFYVAKTGQQRCVCVCVCVVCVCVCVCVFDIIFTVLAFSFNDYIKERAQCWIGPTNENE